MNQNQDLRDSLARQPGQVLEALAAEYQTSLETVLQSLPAEMWQKTEGTRILVVEAHGIGREDLICKEKMCPVMTCHSYNYFEEALDYAKTNLFMEGSGHTAGIHSNNQANIIKAGMEISVSRLIVNASCSITAGGSIQNGLSVTTTLGCGTWGNNSISENFTYKHLLNITRIAQISPHIQMPSDEEIWQMK